jgi:hypothetical protein
MIFDRVGALAVGLFQLARAEAAELVPHAAPPADVPPSWFVNGSLSLPYSDNALETPSDARPSPYADPDITLGWKGNLPSGFRYQFYARATADKFAEVQDADDSFSLLGARLGHDLFGGKAYAVYENRQYYVGAFGPLDYVTNDLRVGISWELAPAAGLKIAPRASIVYRDSANADVRRFLLDVSADLEKTLVGKWSVVTTPQIRDYWFVAGVNSGRHDIKYTDSLGIKYTFNDAVSLTTAVKYEVRTSNVATKAYRDLEFGPELDFSF